MRESRRLEIGLIWLALLAVPSMVALADQADTEDVEDEAVRDLVEYVEVNLDALPSSNTIATKLSVPLQLTPANVGAVTAPLLREQAATVLGDALRNVSGLNIQAGPAVHDFFSIRGFDSLSSGLVLTDGASEPEATFYPLYNVEGIEVLKGPGGFLYGANPLAGTVNMVRKQPLPGNFTVLGGSLGSHATFEGTLDWNLSTEDGRRAFRLNSLWQESDQYRDDKESRVAAVNPSLTFKLGEQSTLNLNLEYVDAEFSPDSGIALFAPDPFQPSQLAIPNVPRENSYQSPVDFSNQEIGRIQVNFETRINDRLTLRNKTYYRSMDWQSVGTLLNGTIPTGGDPLVLRTLTRLDDDQEFVGNQFEAIVSVETGSVTHNLLAGLEVANYTDEFAIDVLPPQGSLTGNPLDLCDPAQFGMPCIGLNDPVETFTPSGFLPLQAGDARSLIVAPYLVDQMEFSEKFQLHLGARWDDIDFENDLAPAGFESRDDSELSSMAGAVFAPDPSLSLYANAGQSHAPASARVDPRLRPEPEEATQIEIGAKKKFLGGRVQTTFAAYRIDRDNIAITDGNGFTQQIGDQRSEGFEVELAAEPLPRLRTLFSYAYNDSELTSFMRCADPSQFPCPPLLIADLSGNNAPYAPEHLVNLWISRSFKSGFGVAGGARYIGEQFFDADNAFEIDAALVLDAALFYDVDNWRFKLNLKNLTDEEYETGSFSSTSVVPANPFTARGSFEYRF